MADEELKSLLKLSFGSDDAWNELQDLMGVHALKAAAATVLCAGRLGERFSNNLFETGLNSNCLPASLRPVSKVAPKLFFLNAFGVIKEGTYYCLLGLKNLTDFARHEKFPVEGDDADAALMMLALVIADVFSLPSYRKAGFPWQRSPEKLKIELWSSLSDDISKAQRILRGKENIGMTDSALLCFASEMMLKHGPLPGNLKNKLLLRLGKDQGKRPFLTLRIKELLALNCRRAGDPQGAIDILKPHLEKLIDRYGSRATVYEGGAGEEFYGILGAAYKGLWFKDPANLDNLKFALKYYKDAAGFRGGSVPAPYTSINAATVSRILAEQEINVDKKKGLMNDSLKYARSVRDLLVASPIVKKNYWMQASLAEAFLLLGDPRAKNAYKYAFKRWSDKPEDIKTTKAQLELILKITRSPVPIADFLP